MGRFYSLITLAVVTLFAACESAEEQTPTNHLNITSSNMVEVAAEGETVAITYTINNPISGVDVTTNIVEGKEAIEKITIPTTGVILVEVKTNTAASKRLAIINVNYDKESTSIVINQAAGSDNNDGGNDGGNQNDPTDGQEKEAKTTLTGDLVFTFTDTPVVKWVYEGDWWQTGYSNYTIKLMNKPTETFTSHYLQLDIITDNTSSDGDFDGKYTIAYTPNKNVAMAGFVDNQSHTIGCWYCEYGGGSDVVGLKGYAMLIKGSVEITNNGNGTHTVKVDAYDCNDNRITCDWSGEIVESSF